MPRGLTQPFHQIDAAACFLILGHCRKKCPVRSGELRVGDIEDTILQLTLSPLRTSADIVNTQEGVIGMHSPRPVAQKLQHKRKSVDSFNGFAQGLFVDEPTALFHGQTESLLNCIGANGPNSNC